MKLARFANDQKKATPSAPQGRSRTAAAPKPATGPRSEADASAANGDGDSLPRSRRPRLRYHCWKRADLCSLWGKDPNRSYMRLTEKEDETLPIDIVLQTLLAFAVTCYGIVHIAGEFKDMDATSELKNKTFDTLRNHPSFYVFNHRGRVLFQSPDTVNSSSNQDALSSSSSLKFRKLEPLRR
nr:PREDICTED: membrane magnesium transporter 1 [Struthio camelus australis]